MQPGPVLTLIREDKDPKNIFQELPHELFCATMNSGEKNVVAIPNPAETHALCRIQIFLL